MFNKNTTLETEKYQKPLDNEFVEETARLKKYFVAACRNLLTSKWKFQSLTPALFISNLLIVVCIEKKLKLEISPRIVSKQKFLFVF